MKFIIISQTCPGEGYGGSGKVSREWYNLVCEVGSIIEYVTPSKIYQNDFHISKDTRFSRIQFDKCDCILVLHGWKFTSDFWKQLEEIELPKIFRFGDEWPKKVGVNISCSQAIYISRALYVGLKNNVSAEANFIGKNWIEGQMITKHTLKFQFLRLIFVGRLVDHKGYKLLPEIARKLIDSGFEKFKITIAGQGEKGVVNEFKHVIRNLKVETHVKYIGFVERDEVKNLMSQHDLLIFPSLYRDTKTIEGCPNVFLESWISGIPVIGNFFDSAYEHVEPGKDSIAVNSTKTEDWVTALIPIIVNPDLLDNLKKNCLVKANHFNKEKVAKHYKMILNGSHIENTTDLVDKPSLGNHEQVMKFLSDILNIGLSNISTIWKLNNKWEDRDPLIIQYLERLAIAAFILGRITNNFTTLKGLVKECLDILSTDIEIHQKSMFGGCFSLMEMMEPGCCITQETNELKNYFANGANSDSPNNNHLLFHFSQAIIANDRKAISKFQKALDHFIDESDGWFFDGKFESKDYYNSWGFYLYIPLLAMYGKDDWCSNIIKRHGQTFIETFSSNYFDKEGFPIPYGRSLSYRLSTTACFFPLMNSINSNKISIKRLAKIFHTNINLFYQAVGSLGLFYPGWLGISKSEVYTDFGTSLWSLWSFLPLLQDEKHQFWQEFSKCTIDTVDFWNKKHRQDRSSINGPLAYKGNLNKLRNDNLYNGKLYSSLISDYKFPGVNQYWPAIKK